MTDRPVDRLPDGRIEILAGTPQGGGQDRAARALASALGSLVDNRIDVVNVPGRGGGNAWDVLAERHDAPLCVAISSPTLMTNPITGVSVRRHDDYRQLALLCTEYIVFATHPASALQTASDLVTAFAGPHPPTVALATARGNVNHVAVGYVAAHAGSDPAAVDVRVHDSARHAIADTLDGPADVVAVSAASLLPEWETGSIRLLATSAPQRMAEPFDHVPTWREAGVDCTIGTWRGLMAAMGIDVGARNAWSSTLAGAVTTAEWRETLRRNLWADTFLDPVATVEFIAAEQQRLEDALRRLGLVAR